MCLRSLVTFLRYAIVKTTHASLSERVRQSSLLPAKRSMQDFFDRSTIALSSLCRSERLEA